MGVVPERTWQPGGSGLSAQKLVVVGENGVDRGVPGALVPRPARVCRTFPNLQSSQNTALRSLSPGGFPVQAPAENRGPDAPPARLGSLPSHQEQRAGPQPPGEGGERTLRPGNTGDAAQSRPQAAELACG